MMEALYPEREERTASRAVLLYTLLPPGTTHVTTRTRHPVRTFSVSVAA